MTSPRFRVGRDELSIECVFSVAQEGAHVGIDESEGFRRFIESTASVLRSRAEDTEIYGVNTGVGDSCGRRIPQHLIEDFSLNLTRMHGCGLGQNFDPATTRAILIARLASLRLGYSGVRFCILDRLCTLINRDILPLIPEEGSVGASGDLTPLSYVAAVLMGEREVLYAGLRLPAADAYRKEELRPLALNPKEGLAIMNGTSVMTAIACMAFKRAEYLSRLCAALTALSVEALLGNKSHFDARIFDAKPHPGQRSVARWIAGDINLTSAYKLPEGRRIQDTYAIRCAPHVIGVLEDCLPWIRSMVETELNSANDNPLIDPATGDILHGGNFYGGHIAMTMDALKVAVANCADLMDRQVALLVDSRRNSNLPENLSGAPPDRIQINHGFKAIQIASSAWAAEALKLTMPASVFSRSTESHNQDKVSMGTISARDCVRVIELTEQVAAALLLSAVQAIELRLRANVLQKSSLSRMARELFDITRSHSSFVEEDRALDTELRRILFSLREREIPMPRDRNE